MLDNEFDQIFRDRLLDHSSKVRQVLWKQVHTHLVRYNALWKWYFVGPSAIAVAITGYFLVTAIRSSSPSSTKHSSPAAAVATYNTHPNPDSSATAANATPSSTTNPQATTTSPAAASPAATAAASPASASTAPASTAAIPTTPGSAPANPAANPETASTNRSATAASPATTRPDANAASRTAAPASSTAKNPAITSPATASTSPTAKSPAATATANPSTTSPATASATPHSANSAHRSPHHLANTARNHPGHRHGSETGSDDANLTADAGSTSGKPNTGRTSTRATGRTTSASATGSSTAATGTNANKPANATTTTNHPPIPAQLTAPAKLATLKIRPDIAAVTTKPKKSQQLTLPARRGHKLPQMRVDVFGAPEYFTAHIYGFAYGTGARVTVVYKKHWTFTTGIQYLRVAVTGTKDSMGFPSGSIRNLHLPLLLGYTTGNDRFTFSANAGVLLSLYDHYDGEMTYTGYWPSRNGASAYLGFDFASHITKRISVFAEPYLKCWYVLPHTQWLPFNPATFPLKSWSTGLMVGVRYDF